MPATNETLSTLIAARAIEHLRALVRLDTTSPPGNERQATDYIAGVLAAAGIESTVLESAPGRANLVARLHATNPTGRPIMLMGHTDVVSVERDKWERDPFGADLVDGFIWGRGTLDMKNQVAGQLAAFVAIKESGLPLTRDVIYAAFADEEVSGELGAGWMQANHRDLIDAEFALNEGGGGQVEFGGVPFYTCGTGEKGQSILEVTFRGNPGHASTPIPDTAMEKLAIATGTASRLETAADDDRTGPRHAGGHRRRGWRRDGRRIVPPPGEGRPRLGRLRDPAADRARPDPAQRNPAPHRRARPWSRRASGSTSSLRR